MSEKLLEHLPALCNQVRRIALEAGEVTLDYFDDAGFEGADAKSDGSPVTLADQKAEEVIEKALKDILPDVKVVGEEAVADGYRPQLEGVEHFWLVDPLDGTKEFISGSGDYTVNIALIKNYPPAPLSSPLPPEGGGKDSLRVKEGGSYGAPVLGVVYAPAKGELFAAAGEGTAIRWTDESEKDRSISVRRPPKEGLTVVASLNHSNDEKLEKFLADYKVQKLMKRGSSLKICAVAMGKADLYPRLGPTCEWDTAAGHAILLGAGGIMTDIDNKPLTYGGANPKFLNPEFIASSGLI